MYLNPRIALARRLRAAALKHREEILTEMPDEAKERLLLRAIVAHLMDASCTYEGRARIRAFRRAGKQLTEGNLSYIIKSGHTCWPEA